MRSSNLLWKNTLRFSLFCAITPKLLLGFLLITPWIEEHTLERCVWFLCLYFRNLLQPLILTAALQRFTGPLWGFGSGTIKSKQKQHLSRFNRIHSPSLTRRSQQPKKKKMSKAAIKYRKRKHSYSCKLFENVVMIALTYDLLCWMTAQGGWSHNKNLADSSKRRAPPTISYQDIYFVRLQQNRQSAASGYHSATAITFLPSFKQFN